MFGIIVIAVAAIGIVYAAVRIVTGAVSKPAVVQLDRAANSAVNFVGGTCVVILAAIILYAVAIAK